MHANSILALTAVLGVVAASHAGHHHQHLHHKREVVWDTVTQEVIETVSVTKTIWLQPGETAPSSVQSLDHVAPPPANTAVAPAAPSHSAAMDSKPASVPAPPANTPVSSASAPVQPAPSSQAAPVVSSPSQAAPVSSAPVSSSVAPVSSSVAPAAPSSSASSSSGQTPSLPAGAPEGLTYGMAKAGTYYTGDLTYYAVGLGACGWTNTDSEQVVAISHDIFDSYNDNGNPNANPVCGKYVTITGVNGDKWPAKVVDRCVGCDANSLDLPEPLFNQATVNGNGRVSGVTWCFD